MKERDVVLAPLPQSTGQLKNRPAVVLRVMPPYGDFLVCGVTSQLRQEVSGFDDLIGPSDPDFVASGLKAPSLIRLGFLAVLPPSGLLGAIGSISENRHEKLLERLSSHLRPERTNPEGTAE